MSEQGWAAPGEGNFSIARFAVEEEAKSAAAKLWCCWVLYQETETFAEIASGGVGFARYAVRAFVKQKLEAAKQHARRVSVGEPPPAGVQELAEVAPDSPADPAEAAYLT